MGRALVLLTRSRGRLALARAARRSGRDSRRRTGHHQPDRAAGNIGATVCSPTWPATTGRCFTDLDRPTFQLATKDPGGLGHRPPVNSITITQYHVEYRPQRRPEHPRASTCRIAFDSGVTATVAAAAASVHGRAHPGKAGSAAPALAFGGGANTRSPPSRASPSTATIRPAARSASPATSTSPSRTGPGNGRIQHMANSHFRIIAGPRRRRAARGGCTVKEQEDPGAVRTLRAQHRDHVRRHARRVVAGRRVAVAGDDHRARPQRPAAAQSSLRRRSPSAASSTDFGTLSARNIVTDTNGRATVIYTAPPPPGLPWIRRPMSRSRSRRRGTDFRNDIAAPRPSARTARRGRSAARHCHAGLRLDTGARRSRTSRSCSMRRSSRSTTGTIVQWLWNFDDGGTGTGERVTHAFRTAGTKNVRLTVIDSIGRRSRRRKTVTMGQGAATDRVRLSRRRRRRPSVRR